VHVLWPIVAVLAAGARETVYEYDVAVGPAARELEIEARIPRAASGCFEVGEGLETYVAAAEVKEGGRWRPIERTNRCFDVPGGKSVPIRYRFQLAEAAAAASADRRRRRVYEDRGGFFAPPTMFLLRPAAFAEGRYRLKVETPRGLHFVTGLERAGGNTYEGRIEFMDGMPYAVITPDEPSKLRVRGGEIEWVTMPGDLSVPRDAVARWIQTSAEAVAGYFGAFPVPRVAVIVVPPGGTSGGGGGSTMGFGGAAIRIGVRRNVADGTDWVLVHEMVHLALPNLGPDERWLEEGLSTYVEPIARARAGQLTPAQVWGSFVRYMPQGLPPPTEGEANPSAERRQRWGRTYWGGALYWLLADIELLEQTRGRVGLDDVLAAVRREGGDIRVRWDVGELFASAERTAGVPVLRDVHARPVLVPGVDELEAVWRRLGIRRTRDAVELDDEAPLAWIRRRITTGAGATR